MRFCAFPALTKSIKKNPSIPLFRNYNLQSSEIDDASSLCVQSVPELRIVNAQNRGLRAIHRTELEKTFVI